MTRSERYYEAHVTVDAPVAAQDEENWQEFKFLAGPLGWRASKFSEDEVDDYHGKWFLSARGEILEDVIMSVETVVVALSGYGYKVLRWKVEDTVLDSKHGDKLNALRGLMEEA
jgi:hypothetical protein